MEPVLVLVRNLKESSERNEPDCMGLVLNFKALFILYLYQVQERLHHDPNFSTIKILISKVVI